MHNRNSFFIYLIFDYINVLFQMTVESVVRQMIFVFMSYEKKFNVDDILLM